LYRSKVKAAQPAVCRQRLQQASEELIGALSRSDPKQFWPTLTVHDEAAAFVHDAIPVSRQTHHVVAQHAIPTLEAGLRCREDLMSGQQEH
jgi:hypothetical protein